MDTDRLLELTEKFRSLGASDPEAWAKSEIEEGIPQLARFAFLRQAWEKIVSDENIHWIDQIIENVQREPDAPFAGTGLALSRLLTAGASRSDIAEVVRGMQAEYLFEICYLLNGSLEVHESAKDVQWALVQVGEDGQIVGELIGLHESVLETDPTGREMRPIRGRA